MTQKITIISGLNALLTSPHSLSPTALCYVEFASRIFKAGSAYNYTYTSVGEFTAFVIGWNLVLEYVIGTASEAKAISNQIDSLIGNAYQHHMEALAPINFTFLSTYPDLMAASIVLLMSALIAYGVRESTRINSALTFCNLGVVVTIVLSGIFKANLSNWSIARKDIPERYKASAGAGGFFPFGVNGVIVGAAKCFFGFIGFDSIATTGEEAKNPRRNIPLSILISLSVVFVSYVGVAVVLTLIIPYYEQDAEAPFPHIFDVLGWEFMKWLVSIGSMFALMTGMFGALFPLPRILYAMSVDGLIYPSFAYVSPRTQTPLVSAVATGILTAVLSAIFKLDQLVDMMSIGTLLAYTIVSLSVLLLRFSDEDAEVLSIGCNLCKTDTNKLTYKPIDANNTTFKPIDTNDTTFKSIHTISETLNDTSLSTQQNVMKPMPNGMSIRSQLENLNTVAVIRDGKLVLCDPNRHPSLIPKMSNRRRLSPIQDEPIEQTVLHVYDTNDAITQPCEESNTSQQFGTNHSISHDERTPQPSELGLATRYEDSSNIIFHNIGESHPPTNDCDIKNSIGNSHLYINGNGVPAHQFAGKPKCQCKEKPSLKNRIRTLLNLNSPSPTRVTPSSQFVSKVCIYLFVALTIVVCLVLNSVTGVDLNLESTPPNLLSNETSGRSLNYHSSPNTNSSNSNGSKIPNRSFNLSNAGSTTNSASNDFTSSNIVLKGFNAVPNHLSNISKDFRGPNVVPYDFNNSFGSVLRALAYTALGLAYVGTFLVLSRQAQNIKRLSFRVPLVPLTPCLSVCLNVYLMVNLDSSTWVRFMVWMGVGLVVYFSYGITHSGLRTKRVEQDCGR